MPAIRLRPDFDNAPSGRKSFTAKSLQSRLRRASFSAAGTFGRGQVGGARRAITRLAHPFFCIPALQSILSSHHVKNLNVLAGEKRVAVCPKSVVRSKYPGSLIAPGTFPAGAHAFST
jgi:hypothetical protein